MNTAPLEDFLRDTIGLAADTIGRPAVARAAHRSMQAAGLADADAYLQKLRADPGLRQQLVEELVVPETWFFRDEKPFALLAALAVARRRDHGPVRVLSLPCSTGEEPYSMAITLLEAGFAPADFKIDAVDISGVSLATARRANYGTNSFRGDTGHRRDRWFQHVNGRWQLAPVAQAQVTFNQHNLFEFVPGQRYDFVFCRNLLIYFDANTQDSAVHRLLEFLVADGVLFSGHAESAVMLREGLAPWPAPGAFAFTRAAARTPVTHQRPPARATTVVARAPKPAPPAPRPFSDATKVVAAPVATTVAGSALADARALADLGRLDEAVRLVRVHLTTHGPTADALYLIALTEDARGELALAEAGYRKVLYLDPKHTEAITHLALLLEKRGDQSGANRLWQRVKRPGATGGDA